MLDYFFKKDKGQFFPQTNQSTLTGKLLTTLEANIDPTVVRDFALERKASKSCDILYLVSD